jgi:hypothetical protein
MMQNIVVGVVIVIVIGACGFALWMEHGSPAENDSENDLTDKEA